MSAQLSFFFPASLQLAHRRPGVEMTLSVLIIERSVITSSCRPSGEQVRSPCSPLHARETDTAIVASPRDPVDPRRGAARKAEVGRGPSMISWRARPADRRDPFSNNAPWNERVRARPGNTARVVADPVGASTIWRRISDAAPYGPTKGGSPAIIASVGTHRAA